MKKIKDPMSCEDPKDMAKWLKSQGFHCKGISGGHQQWEDEKGHKLPLSTHEKLPKGLRHKIIKEVLAFLLIVICVAIWMT